MVMSVRLCHCMWLQVEGFSRIYVVNFGGSLLLFALAAVLCTYGAITQNGFLRIAFACMACECIFLLVLFILALATVNQYSQRSLEVTRLFVLRGHSFPGRNWSWLRREARSLRICSIRIGSLFHYDRILVLTTFSLLLQYSVTLLLMA